MSRPDTKMLPEEKDDIHSGQVGKLRKGYILKNKFLLFQPIFELTCISFHSSESSSLI
jgi:hypothetical protein